MAFGPTAWLALGVLAVLLLATLWERWELAEMVSLLLVAAAVPCLVAGQFAQPGRCLGLAVGLGDHFHALVDRRLAA